MVEEERTVGIPRARAPRFVFTIHYSLILFIILNFGEGYEAV
jgi:hypothetical protein